MIILDKEFQALIPPLSAEEKAQLEENIVAEGCRDALITWQGILLDGHNRYEICERLDIPYRTISIDLPDRDAAADWIDKNQLGRRNLTPDQMSLLRGRRYNRAKKAPHRPEKGDQNDPLNPQKTADRLAKEHGVSPATIKRDGKIAAFMDEHPEEANAVIRGEKKLKDVKKKIKKRKTEKALVAAQKSISDEARQSIESVCDIRVCSCGELFASGIKPDAVITDPPYPKEYLHLFNVLAESCAAAAVPLVAVMSGQTYLPEVMQMLCKHLKYRWALAYLTPGGQAVQQFPVKVNCFWKPVLLFGEAVDWIGDVCKSQTNDNDKRFHDWGQSESGMSDLIERLTKPGDLICDPFLGGGTTAVVSLALGRKFVGCDIDAACVEKAKQRVEASWK
jgi:site-specific DNA-methyltransferase (adenine-specific)